MRRLLCAALVLAMALIGSPASAAPPLVWYEAHVQDVGDQRAVWDGATAGTTGESRRLEALHVYGTPIEYRVHSQEVGWGPWVQDQWAGTRGRSLRAEAVQVRMAASADPALHVEYRAHVQDVGWQPWVSDGATAGTTGRALRMEAVQIRLVYKPTPTATPTPTAGRDSNRPIDQTAMLAGYRLLPASTIAASDRLTVTINHSASVERQRLAVRDADNARLSNITAALGPRLSGYLADLTAAGQLPRFRALLAGGADAMETPNSSSADAKWAYGVVRPINWPNSPIERVPSAGNAYTDVGTSPSFPSGHSRTAHVVAASLAIMLPEVAPQLLDRGADAGHSRIVLGVHTPLDVIGGKAVGLRMVAQRLDDPAFRRDVFEPAMREVRAALEAKCGMTIAKCADAPAASGTYRQRLTYGLPQTGRPGVLLAVPAGAEALLTYSHPTLTAQQRAQIIAQTAIDSGYPLDLTGQTGEHVGWTRIDLAAALTR